MKLNTLEITSEFRLTQPAAGGDSLQNIDIKFSTDAGMKASSEFYDLVWYGMLNGNVIGSSDIGVTTGIKAIYYDANGAVLHQSPISKLEKVSTEKGTELIATLESVYIDGTATVYITKIDYIYVSNDNNTPDEKLIFTSTTPQKTTFAEATGVGTGKGVAVPIGSDDSKLTSIVKMYYIN